ncbi:histidinol-phosphate aminotransferase HisC [Gottschalkia acidurici 9a]|uniref:Histidinol-phosphate aminotransferase n=1 Tax=Gottschalkia acidurici (strain ATCC 7906 / DSM 604 / BCRC 14475 / CIP 104303 / KCTC 5404 / NCIMB 10678 / 9a) TaxID=1128398 RepID=K0B406_GOTA9|nr:histidinol-phosphate transaminase [Gottschalkia acidurici]AFS79852.1 histidinol-phosphate aminotransferase HisC [Gottschalkia acidurici 9a]
MSKYWSEITKEIKPYIPGEQPKDKTYIKLNTNENPYPPSKRVIEAIKNTANEKLKLYPEPTVEKLRDTIGEYYSLKNTQVFIGNGSDEVLAFAFMAFFNPGETIIFPDITYSFYPVYANLFKINYNLISLDDNFSIPIESFSEKNSGIIFPNPNAPTGKYIDIEYIEEILKKNMDKVVIVDEAYIDFGGISSAKLVNKYPNLLVIQTLSKSRSLAGLRVGFALGHEDLIEGLNRIKNSINSYTIDTLALYGSIEAIKDEGYFEETRTKIINTRERISNELKNIGFYVIESKANFVFISHSSVNAEELFIKLKEKGILVRYFNSPRIDNFLRVSIGTDEEMDAFVKGVKEILNS